VREEKSTVREEKHVERIDEAMNDEKLTWDKPALKVFSIDDTASCTGTPSDFNTTGSLGGS